MKKKFKSIFAVALCFVMLLGTVAVGGNGFAEVLEAISVKASAAETVSSGTCGDNLTWTLYDESTLIISGTGDMEDYTYLSDNPWCSFVTSIKNVVIEDGVTSIGDMAFDECSNLVNINIPYGVKTIGLGAFADCTSLKSITIPDSVTSIDKYAFDGCTSLTDVYYCGSESDRNNITSGSCNEYLENSTWHYDVDRSQNCIVASGKCGENITWTFNNSRTLSFNGTGDMANYANLSDNPWYSLAGSVKNVEIENGITGIGNFAFGDCKHLENVSIPDSVTSIGEYSFELCYSLKELKIPDNVSSIGDYAFCYCPISSINIPDGVTRIGDCTFSWCTYLENVTIPDSVTIIGDMAFSCCSGLTNITIPDSVTSIGCSAFEYCTSLTEVYYSGSEADRKNITIGTENDCLKNATWHYSTDENENRDDNITWSLINGTLTISGTGKMTDYTNDSPAPWYSSREIITNVVIENGITNIGDYAFYYCTNLTNITIPDSVTSIGTLAFCGCSSLTSLNIPYNVTNLYSSAFENCPGLESIVVDKNNSTYDSRNNCNAIIATSTNTLIAGCKNTVIPDSVTSIGIFAFCGCTELTNITIPDSVTSISFWAFTYCPGLESIVVDKSNSTYDSRNNCNAIIDTSTNTLIFGCKNTVIPYSVTSIGDFAFDGCTSLTDITIPDSVTSIGIFAFLGCTSLTDIIIPDSIININTGAFSVCTSLTDVYYAGSEEGRGNITIETENDCLENAIWHYSYASDTSDEMILENEDGVKISYTPGTFDSDKNIFLHSEILTNAEGNVAVGDNFIGGIGSNKVYNIYPTINGEKVQPRGKVKVTLPIDAGYDSSKVKVFHYTDNNGTISKETIRNSDITFHDNYIEFYVDHFSYFTIDYEPTINVSASKTVDYRTKTTIKATATGVPEGYYLVMNVNGTEVKGTNTSVKYNAGELKGNLSYTVRIVDGNGSTQTDSDGNALTNGGSVNCKSGFLQKLIAFFKGLFGSLPATTIQP